MLTEEDKRMSVFEWIVVVELGLLVLFVGGIWHDEYPKHYLKRITDAVEKLP